MSAERLDTRLTLDGVDLGAVAAEHGTPLYVYGGDTIRATYGALCAALPPDVDVHFSVKANPSLAVCRLLAREGAGAEIASAGELALALAAGFAPERILFAGPGKSDAELVAALEAGVGAVHAESVGEVQRLGRLARAHDREQAVALRINLDGAALPDAAIVTGGGAQKFGIDASRCGPALDALARSSALRFHGFHVFNGSQFADHNALLTMVDASLDTLAGLCERHDLRPAVVDLGGGLGVPHEAEAPAFDIGAFGAGLAERLERAAGHPGFAETRWVLEPGRALVSAAGVYLTRVLDVKRSGDHTFALVDGGIHHALLPITSNRYRVEPVERAPDAGVPAVHLAGPLCTSADQWTAGVPGIGARVGDLLAVLNAGAYGLSASMPLFLSHGVPAEVLLLDGEAHPIRRRATPADLLAGQSLPDALR